MGTREPLCRARAEVETSPFLGPLLTTTKSRGEPQSFVHAFKKRLANDTT